MTVSEMTAQVYSILGLPSTGTPDLTAAIVLQYLNEAHNKLARRTKCYRRSTVVSPVMQAKATGTITIDVANVSDGDYVTINGLKYTFKTALTATYQVLIGSSNTETATFLNNALNGVIFNGNCLSGTFPNPFIVSSVSTNVVTLTAIQYGTEANDYTLVKSGTALSVSGAKMTGGVNGYVYSLPVDYLEMDNIRYGNRNLEATSMAMLNDKVYLNNWKNTTAGTPFYWYNYGAGKFGVDRAPDCSSAFYLDIICVPNSTVNVFPVLVSDTSPTNITDEFCMILVYDACVRALGTSIGDTVDGVQLRLQFCTERKESLIGLFMAGMVAW